MVIKERQGDEYGRAQIGLLVAVALARRDAGRVEEYVDDLDDALLYAVNMGYEDMVVWLRQVLAELEQE